MSRSNPTESTNPNPAVRWFEWHGEKGVVRYYDKALKENVEVGSDFTFLLLDQLASVRGWHDASESGIYANEVKDTTQETLIVKAFKGGTLAEGRYRDIKDRVNAMGGQFVANLYVAFKDKGTLAIGSLRLKGAALSAWMEFGKAHRGDLYTKAIRIHGCTEGKKGRIVFRMPVLKLADITSETQAAALALDQELQAFFDSYFKRTKREQVEAPAPDHDVPDLTDEDRGGAGSIMDEDSIPFAWLLPLVLPFTGLLTTGMPV